MRTAAQCGERLFLTNCHLKLGFKKNSFLIMHCFKTVLFLFLMFFIVFNDFFCFFYKDRFYDFLTNLLHFCEIGGAAERGA